MYKARTTKKEGKCAFNNIWVQGDLIHSGGKCYIHPTNNYVRVEGEIGELIVMHEVDPKTICRSSEKKDCKGQTIFDNDIIRINNMIIDVVGVVRHGTYPSRFTGDVRYGWRIDFAKEILGAAYLKQELEFWTEYGLKVIGNAFDSSEPLEV